MAANPLIPLEPPLLGTAEWRKVMMWIFTLGGGGSRVVTAG